VVSHSRGLPSLIKPDLSPLAQLWPGAAGIALSEFTGNHRRRPAPSPPPRNLSSPTEPGTAGHGTL
jgi:hypothetical protein